MGKLNSYDKRRLAKNTVMLFIRMIITIFIGLYTSRIILKTLGHSDYGLFNVVGGTVTMFSFFSSTLSGATQRFLNIAIGIGKKDEIIKTFNSVFTIHLLLALLFFIFIAFIGFYIVTYNLNIPDDRFTAAIYVLFFCTFSTCFDILIVPFNANIIAHEDMDFYAYISIFEATLKLIIVFLLEAFPYSDSLIIYAILYSMSSAVLLVVYFLYCKIKYIECKNIKFYFDKKKIISIGAYVSWSLIGNISFMLSTQGVNMLFNIFGNTIINAARGLSTQVSNILTRFTGTLSTATNPQIVKLYASGNLHSMYILTKNSSKFTSFLAFLLLIPMLLETDYILYLWLNEVPEHTVWFTKIMLINVFFSTMTVPLHCTLTATGHIRNIQICTGLVNFSLVIATYFFLRLGYSVDIAIILNIFPRFILIFFYLYYINKYLGFSMKSYFDDVVLKLVLVLLLSTPIPYIAHIYLANYDVIRLISVFTFTLLSLILSIYLFGIDPQTRISIKDKILLLIKL